MAPEHRLSLQLKRQELWEKGRPCMVEVMALDRLAALPFLDILDESDELLHYRCDNAEWRFGAEVTSWWGSRVRWAASEWLRVGRTVYGRLRFQVV